jgi:hypothetical protein
MIVMSVIHKDTWLYLPVCTMPYTINSIFVSAAKCVVFTPPSPTSINDHFVWRNSPTRVMAASFLRLLDHTQWHTTVGVTPLDEGSARRRDNTQHSQETYIHTSGVIRSGNPSKRLVADRRLRPLGHDSEYNAIKTAIWFPCPPESVLFVHLWRFAV